MRRESPLPAQAGVWPKAPKRQGSACRVRGRTPDKPVSQSERQASARIGRGLPHSFITRASSARGGFGGARYLKVEFKRVGGGQGRGGDGGERDDTAHFPHAL